MLALCTRDEPKRGTSFLTTLWSMSLLRFVGLHFTWLEVIIVSRVARAHFSSAAARKEDFQENDRSMNHKFLDR